MFRKKRQQYLRCCTDRATVSNVPPEHSTARIGNRHVQMRSIRCYGPGERQDFQIVTQLSQILISGKSQLGNAEAPDALDHKGRLQFDLRQQVFEGGTQIVAGMEAQRMCLHQAIPG